MEKTFEIPEWKLDPKLSGSPIQDPESYVKTRDRIMRWMFGLNKIEIIGKENIPENEPLIISSTHRGFSDIPAVAHLMKDHGLVSFLAKKEIADWPKIGKKTFGQWGAIPVNRNDLELNELEPAIEVLYHSKDPYLGLFPEGGTKKGDEVQKLFGGIGFIACLSQTKILPVAIKGPETHPRIVGFSNLLITVGEPVTPQRIDTDYMYKGPKSLTKDSIRSRELFVAVNHTRANIHESMQQTYQRAIMLSK